MPTEDLLSPIQAAKKLGVTRNTIYRWISEGRLPSHKYGPRTIRIAVTDIDALTTRSTT